MQGRKKFAVLTAAILCFCLFLSGCGLKSETLDAQLDLVLSALNRDDRDAFVALLYPGLGSESDMEEGYRQIREVWIPTERESVKLVRYNFNASSGQKMYQGIYQLPRSDEYGYLEIVYLETAERSGLVGLHMGMIEESQKNTSGIGQWIFTILYLAFVLFTIVDVVRKKPRKYGWYIVLSFLYFSLRVNSFAVTIPLGSILYWCVRRKLLMNKAAMTMTPDPSVPLAQDLSEDGQDEQNPQ